MRTPVRAAVDADLPVVTYAPMRDSNGGTAPGVAAMGFF